MTDTPKDADERRLPLKTIRNGAIAANIWRRQTPTGYGYLDFSLSRSWKLASGEKEGYSSSFFEQNETALLDVISRAADYIRTHSADPIPAENDQPAGPKPPPRKPPENPPKTTHAG